VSRARAIAAFEDFKGERPSRLRRAQLPDADVTGWQMGPLVGVAYEARRDGKTAQYFHEFTPRARPNLVAQDDGKRLYIEGGRYKVTDKGIEDMPNLFVVNPSPRRGSKARKGSNTMARRAHSTHRRRRSHVTVFTSNPRRRRRAGRSASGRFTRRSYARNPSRRRRTHHHRRAAARRVYRRNPIMRRNPRRRFRRNPSGGVGKLSAMVLPAVFIGLGAVGSEIVCGYLPIPLAWKAGPMRYIVKGAVGVGIGLVLAKAFKQKRLGYYFAAGAIAIATHDFVKNLIASNAPAVRGLGYVNPASVARFGQYGRRMPSVFGSYYPRMPSLFGGAADHPNARQPGGEMNFSA
jgi:hypothetical protein